eukprot:TRINITY_DN19305_c0_g1_i1.p1 TRINITY_DN19305_c0_g1~~TRINITY_DN19305_c0_g1_i1.p1  ORF type:complete len:112 (+),score=19.33 TRINITY_DN19305_c0_g1_i1:98-433(+)
MASESLPAIKEGDVKEPETAKRFMAGLMNTTVRLHVSDGRIISGQLWCFDQLRNSVLLNGHETRIAEDGEEHHRSLGPLVMVPGKHILKFEATKPNMEAAVAAAHKEPADE